MAKIISVTVMNWVTPKAGAKHELLFEEAATAPYCLPRLQEIVVPVAMSNIMAPHAVPKQKTI